MGSNVDSISANTPKLPSPLSKKNGAEWSVAELLQINRDLRAELGELRRAEASRRLPMQVLRNIPGVAWSVTPDGRCDFINRFYLEATGLTAEFCMAPVETWRNDPEDLPPFLRGVHPDHKLRAARTFWGGVRSGTSWAFEAPFLHADKQYHWHFDRAVALKDKTGRVVRFVGTCADIDALRLTEDALAKAQAELARVTRVTVLGELATSIAHEINQPLAAIVTNIDTCLHWLSKRSINREKARAAVRRMQGNAQHACEVIGRVRTLLGRRSPERVSLTVNNVVRETLSLVGAELRTRKVAVVTHFRDPGVQLIADRVQLQQVILNLVMNAIEAMGESAGHCEGGARQRTLTISCGEVPPGNVLVTVEDTGPGLDPQLLERVFDPFFTTKQSGMGMGLAISRSIIDAHGGRLWASRVDPAGTRFQFLLPVDGGDGS